MQNRGSLTARQTQNRKSCCKYVHDGQKRGRQRRTGPLDRSNHAICPFPRKLGEADEMDCLHRNSRMCWMQGCREIGCLGRELTNSPFFDYSSFANPLRYSLASSNLRAYTSSPFRAKMLNPSSCFCR